MRTTKTYIIQAADTNYFKIGKTKRSVHKRLKELQTGSKDKLSIYKIYNKDIEVELHKKYAADRVKGTEWFQINEFKKWRFRTWMAVPALAFIYFCEWIWPLL